MGLLGIADIHRHLGHDEQGRAVYLEAVSLARGSNELQMLVPALAGLARLEAVTATDHARAAAEEAERIATPALMPFALVSLGWVALAEGDRMQAAQRGRDAVASARSTRSFDLLADALELVGEATDDADEARVALAESLSIWRDGGAGPAAARIEVLLGGLDGANGTIEVAGPGRRAHAAADRHPPRQRTSRRRGADGQARRDRRPRRLHRQHQRTTRTADRLAFAPGSNPRQDPCGAARSAAHACLRLRAVVARRRSPEDRSPPVGPAHHRARACSTPSESGRRSATSPRT